MATEVRAALVAARALIESEATWIQGDFARTVDGMPVPPTYATAHLFCALGAVFHVVSQRGSLEESVYQALKNAAGGPVGDFNDSHTHAEVLAAFDKAISNEEEKSV